MLLFVVHLIYANAAYSSNSQLLAIPSAAAMGHFAGGPAAAASSCQYHQAMLLEAAARGDPSAISAYQQHKQHLHTLEPNVDHLLVCPLSSQYNALPQFPAPYLSPTLKRQQRLILTNLNASFSQHLPLFASHSNSQIVASTAASNNQQQQQNFQHQQQTGSSNQVEMSSGGSASQQQAPVIDDALINEIITPIVLDAAYASAKEQLVRRRKLEKELVRQGKHSQWRLRNCERAQTIRFRSAALS